MSKVLLINPPQSTRYPQPPIGLALLASVLERDGYEVKIKDANLGSPYLLEELTGTDYVGITAMTPSIASALTIAHRIKSINPRIKIVLGGNHATLLPKETLQECVDLDFIVSGEGEYTFLKLIRSLEYNQTLHNVGGIYYRNGGGIVKTPEPAQVDMDELPYPAFHLLPYEKYRPHPPHGRLLPFMPMLTSRGCPYRCTFCAGSVFGKRFRSQSAMRVVDEMEYSVQQYGIKEFGFYDDIFVLDKQRVHEICDEILKRNLKILWTCEARVNLVDKELLSHMKATGCYSVAYGIESGSEAILTSLDKDITLQQVCEAVRLSGEVGLESVGYFMVGSPDETCETIKQTIQFAQRLKLDYAQFSVTMPFPGTKLYDRYFTNGKHPSWDSFVYAGTGNKVSPVFESDELSREDIQNYAHQAYKQFYMRPSYVWQRLSSIRSYGDIKVLAKGLKMLGGM